MNACRFEAKLDVGNWMNNIDWYLIEDTEPSYSEPFVEWTCDVYFDSTRWWVHDKEAMTTEELYEYWLNEIKDN